YFTSRCTHSDGERMSRAPFRVPERGWDAHLRQRRSQSRLVHAPKVVLPPVDESDRDLLAVLSFEPVVAGDAALFPRHAEFTAYPLDDLPGVVTQVTPRAAQQDDAGVAHEHDHIRQPQLGCTHAASPPL